MCINHDNLQIMTYVNAELTVRVGRKFQLAVHSRSDNKNEEHLENIWDSSRQYQLYLKTTDLQSRFLTLQED